MSTYSRIKCFELLVCLFLGVVVLIAVGVVFLGLQARESGSDSASNESLVDRNITNDNDDKSSLVVKNVIKESDDNSSLVDKNVTKESDEKCSVVDKKCVKTMSVNEESCLTSDEKENHSTTKKYERSSKFELIVNKTLEKLHSKTFELLLSNLSSFNDPDYKSDSGVKAAEWLISQLIQTIEKHSDYAGNVTIKRFLHSWKQPTVIVRFEGTDPALKSQLVLLGAELDTKYENNSTPGPWDNVGGSVVLLETTRVLLETNFIPKRSMELHWYASGEDIEKERGEIDIAECYTRSGVNVISMVTFDTICYYLPQDEQASSSKSNNATKKRLFEWGGTFNTLTAYLLTVDKAVREKFSESYTVINMICRIARCFEDKTSWTTYNVTTAWPFVFPCYLHPKKDSQTLLNINRALHLARIATAYAIEMAEPRNLN